MLVRYGHMLDLERKHSKALEQYDRAAKLWPQCGLPRYRLAIAHSFAAAKSIDDETFNEQKELAGQEFRRAMRGLRWDVLSLRRLSILERADATPFSHRRAHLQVMKTASRVNEVRRGQTEGTDGYSGSRYALVHYNMACYYAVQVPPKTDKAFERLQAVLTCPDADRVSGPWMLVDPDLKSVRADPTFGQKLTTLTKMLPEGDTAP